MNTISILALIWLIPMFAILLLVSVMALIATICERDIEIVPAASISTIGTVILAAAIIYIFQVGISL